MKEIMKQKIKETWRGWQGHLCVHCRFHLNTLIEYKDKKIVVSTVGNWLDDMIKKYGTIGIGRKFETYVFNADLSNEWLDADVTEQLAFSGAYNTEKQAQKGHYKILNQVKEYIIKL
jgi:hypothetical protein